MLKLWLGTIGALMFIFLLASSAHGALEEKTIVLTFDDGPNPSVLKDLLPLLKENRVHASFFVIGSVAKEREDWLLGETMLGHSVENHSWGHENMKKVFAKNGAVPIEKSLEKTAEVIQEATHKHPKYFRPPYWEINKNIETIAHEQGYEIMNLEYPDINSLDYEDVQKKRPMETLIERVKKLIADREKKGLLRHVLVFHELPLTVAALRELLPYFATQGYQFVSLEH